MAFELISGKRVGMRTRYLIGVLLLSSGVAVATASTAQPPSGSVQAPPAATYRSSVDLVRIAAIVRDRKGRLVPELSAGDFEVLDSGQRRPITDFHRDASGLSVALLFDISGSMDVSEKLTHAREAAEHLLSWLDPARDETALFTFDTRLQEIAPFALGRRALPALLATLRPFGATSLHDAIAQTAERVGVRDGHRRALVVLTDGNDNASRLSPSEVSRIASAIELPVYLIGVVPAIDNPSADITTVEHSALAGPLAELATWTGGRVFIASTAAERSMAARQIVDELRHQYLIAFESSGQPGWHPLVVRARDKDLIVSARSGYVAGNSRSSTE